jgi:ribosomal protein S12 methylthiotransferase
VGFVSLGCPKNLVDSEVMMGLLQQAGAELVSGAEDADVIVVNTCSFIASAQQESVNTILEMAKHKSTGRARKLVVAGCLVERFRNDIRQNIPEVDAVVGTGELEGILVAAGIAPARPVDSPFRILQSRAEGDARAEQGRFSRESWDGAIADLPNYLYTKLRLACCDSTSYCVHQDCRGRGLVFCIIPQLRGVRRGVLNRNRRGGTAGPPGVREITLIGQTPPARRGLGLKDGRPAVEKLAGIGPRCARFTPIPKVTGRR